MLKRNENVSSPEGLPLFLHASIEMKPQEMYEGKEWRERYQKRFALRPYQTAIEQMDDGMPHVIWTATWPQNLIREILREYIPSTYYRGEFKKDATGRFTNEYIGDAIDANINRCMDIHRSPYLAQPLGEASPIDTKTIAY
ncbi:MAG: hypothetical protein KDK51_02130 [Deltaproteobacteria bacterium]|nr:hypothetical protein [Deltaproteobacteria bacterium]